SNFNQRVNTARPKAVVNAVKGNNLNAVKTSGNHQMDLQDQGVIDSGCSRHMRDGKKIIITEASIRRDIQLADKEGVDCLSNYTISEQLTLMGYEKVSQKLTLYKPFFSSQWKFLVHTVLQCLSPKTTAWNEFSSTVASAIICLATNSKFNFSKWIFDTMIRNLDNMSGKFLMYPRGNTLQSDEDRLELNELMELCTNLQTRVLDLEKTKTTQSNEIASLKRRVKKLEKRNRSRTHKLKRLYEGRIEAINADENITLVNVQDDADMFDVNDLGGKEVFVTEQEVVKDVNENVVEEVVNAAQDCTATTTITTKELTLAQALEALKTSKPKMKGIVIQEQEEPGKSTTTIATIPKQQSQDKGKGIMIEEPIKPKKKDQIRLDEEAAKRAFKRVNTSKDIRTELVKGKEKRAGEELIQESTKKQKVDDDKEITELKKLMEIILDKEELEIDVIPLAVKSPKIVDWKIHKKRKEKILSNNLEDLYKLVKARYGSTRPVEDLAEVSAASGLQ
nr:ribonuclease H-like domain, reverse transcriptase, RNA-dependent DNA polymerase [Tanacetum cinerariifolium]